MKFPFKSKVNLNFIDEEEEREYETSIKEKIRTITLVSGVVTTSFATILFVMELCGIGYPNIIKWISTIIAIIFIIMELIFWKLGKTKVLEVLLCISQYAYVVLICN